MEMKVNIPNASKFTPEEIQRAMTDPVYFINTFCWTFDPRPDVVPHDMPFILYDFQEEYVVWLVDHIRKGKDCFTDKSRDMGASWIVLAVLVWFWLFEPGFQALIGSRKEDLVDNATLDSLFGKIDYLLRRCLLLPAGFSLEKNRTYMKLVNPMNGNVIKGESANAEYSRQGRYRVAFMDEGAFWDHFESAWTAAGDATPCRMIVTTPSKKPSFAKYLRHSGRIDVKVLNWRSHPKKTQEWYDEECRSRTPEEVAREIDNNWEGSITGRVYPEIEQIRIGDFPYRPDWPLYISHDPGHDPDPHAMGWFQMNPENGRIRILESYEATKKIAPWFGPLFGYPIDSEFVYTPEELELVDKVKEWKRGSHMGDLYGTQKSQSDGNSLYGLWYQLFKITVNINRKAIGLDPRKAAARRVLMKLDVNDTPNNKHFVECIKNSRYPDLSEQSNRITANDKPIHDWTSHKRSMLEYFAVNFEDALPPEEENTSGTFLSALASVQSSHNSEYLID
jgi:hypothetical protein